MPHTLLELSEQTWNEVVSAFRKAGLAHVFIERDDLIILDEMGDVCFAKRKAPQKGEDSSMLLQDTTQQKKRS
jgi:hypothetical protein